MALSAFHEFEAAEPVQGEPSSLAARHAPSGLPVRVHLPPLSPDELLKRIATRLRFDHPGLPRILAHGVSQAAVGDLPSGTPYFVTETLDPVSEEALPRRWSTLRDRLIQLLECMSEAHAYNAFHGALSFRSLFQVPGESPPVLRVEGWYLDGTGRLPSGLQPALVAPECAGVERISPSELVQMDLYGVGNLAWRLTCGSAPGSDSDDSAMRRFEPLFRVPSGFAQWMQELLREHPGDRPRAARSALNHLLEVDRLRRTIPPGAVDARIPTEPPLERAHGVRREEVHATLPLLAQRRIPLVGRRPLKGSLWSHFRLCSEQRRTEVLLLDGEAGVGKTRLADWLFRAARREGLSDGLQVRHGAGGAEGSALLGALQRHLQSEALDADALLDRCAQWLRRAGEGRRTIAQLLAALVRDGGGMSPQERHKTLRSLISVLCQDQPIILWIDDLHWGRDSLEFLFEVLEGPPIPQLLVLGTIRDEALADQPIERELLERLARYEQVTRYRVGALDDAAMTQLTQEHLHLTPASARALRRRSEGNPLFAIQWVQHAVAQGWAVIEDEGIALKQEAWDTLPKDAIKLFWQRLEDALGALPEPDRAGGVKALAAAAVLGSPFDDHEWTLACENLNFGHKESLLQSLMERQIIRPAHERLGFVHGLLREAALEEAARRGELDAAQTACGTALNELFAKGDRRVAERLYVLLKHSGQLKDALAPLLVAADRAQTRLDLEHTMALLSEAAALCDQLELAPNAPARLRLMTFQAEGYIHRHLLEKALETAQAADSLAQGEGLPELAARAQQAAANALLTLGRLPEALEAFTDLVQTNRQLKSPRHQAQSLVGLARVLENLGQIGDAKAHLDDALGLLEGGGVQSATTQAVALRHRAAIAQVEGDLPQAQSMLAEALTLENETGNQPALLITMSFMGELCLRLNRPERARRLCSDAAAGLKALGSDRAHHALMQLGYLAIADRDAFALTSHIAELDELLERQPSERRSLRIAALKLWLSAQHAEWSSWDELSASIQTQFQQQGIYNLQLANALGSAALLCAQKAQANRALSIVDLAVQILRRLERHDDRRALRQAFSALERLESARLS